MTERDDEGRPLFRLARDTVIHASNLLRKEGIDSRPDAVAKKILRHTQADTNAAAVLAFVNRFDEYSRKASSEVHRELMRLAVREFGVRPEWFYHDDDGKPEHEAEVLAWESQDPTYSPIPESYDDRYDTRHGSKLEHS